jgi:stage IV sporulation protein FA
MKNKKYLKSLFVRVLLSIILFLALSIFVNYSNSNLLLFKNHVYDSSFKFNKISKIYNKYFGKVIPIKENATVASKIMNYSKANTYKDGAVLSGVSTVYPFKSGIVVFVGEKDDYGSTVIIEGMDGIDYWYGNITDVNVKLYDYVESDNIIGNALKNKLYVVFMKDGKALNYEDYL